MKKHFSLILVITLILILCTSLVACNKEKYSKKDNTNNDIGNWESGEWTDGIEVSTKEVSYSESTKSTLKSAVKDVIDTFFDCVINDNGEASSSANTNENDEEINQVTDIIITVTQKAGISENSLVNAANLTSSCVPSFIIRWSQDGTWPSYDYKTEKFISASNPIGKDEIDDLNSYYTQMLNYFGEDAIGQLLYQGSLYTLDELIEKFTEDIAMYNNGASSEMSGQEMFDMCIDFHGYYYSFEEYAELLSTLRYYASVNPNQAADYNDLITTIQSNTSDDLSEAEETLDILKNIKTSVQTLTAKEFVIVSRLGFAAINTTKDILRTKGLDTDIEDAIENIGKNNNSIISKDDIIQYFKDYRDTFKQAKLDSNAFNALYSIIGDLIKLVPSISYLNSYVNSNDPYETYYNINVIKSIYSKLSGSDLEFMYDCVSNIICSLDDTQINKLYNYIGSYENDYSGSYFDAKGNRISSNEYYRVVNSERSNYTYYDNNNIMISKADYNKVKGAHEDYSSTCRNGNGEKITYSEFSKKENSSAEDHYYNQNGIEITEFDTNVFAQIECEARDSEDNIIYCMTFKNLYYVDNNPSDYSSFCSYTENNSFNRYEVSYYLNNNLLAKMSYNIFSSNLNFYDKNNNEITEDEFEELVDSNTTDKCILIYYNNNDAIAKWETNISYTDKNGYAINIDDLQDLSEKDYIIYATLYDFDGKSYEGYMRTIYTCDGNEINAEEYYKYQEYYEEKTNIRYYDGNYDTISKEKYEEYLSIMNDYHYIYDSSTNMYYDGDGEIITEAEYNSKYNYTHNYDPVFYDAEGNEITESQFNQIKRDAIIAAAKLYNSISSTDLTRAQSIFETIATSMNTAIKSAAENYGDFDLTEADQKVSFDTIKADVANIANLYYGVSESVLDQYLDTLEEDIVNYLFTITPYFMSIVW